MAQFYRPDLGANPNNPFARDAGGKLIRRAYWLDMSDATVVMALTQGIGAALPNNHKRAHLDDIGRPYLAPSACPVDVLPPKRQ